MNKNTLCKILINCRNRLSIGILGFALFLMNCLLYKELTEWRIGWGYVFGIGYILLPLLCLFLLLFFIENTFKKLRLPECISNNKIFKFLHIINVLNIFTGSILPIILLCYLLTELIDSLFC